MIDLTKFRENADERGICGEYSEKWADCVSKKQLMDLALDVNGTIYLCNAIANGWGLSPEFIEDKFAPFINGKYDNDKNGYTAQLYCGYNGEITKQTTLLTLINCDARVCIPRNHICEINAVCNTKIRLYGGGKVKLVAYGEEKEVEVVVEDDTQCRRTQKKDGGYEQ